MTRCRLERKITETSNDEKSQAKHQKTDNGVIEDDGLRIITINPTNLCPILTDTPEKLKVDETSEKQVRKSFSILNDFIIILILNSNLMCFYRKKNRENVVERRRIHHQKMPHQQQLLQLKMEKEKMQHQPNHLK